MEICPKEANLNWVIHTHVYKNLNEELYQSSVDQGNGNHKREEEPQIGQENHKVVSKKGLASYDSRKKRKKLQIC